MSDKKKTKPLEVCRENLRDEFKKKERLENMRNGFRLMEERTEEFMKSNRELYEGYADHIKETRKKVIENLEDALKETIENFMANGVNVHGPYDAKDANKKVFELLGNERFVVKSKTKVTKEIALTKYLESMGVEVVETDVGDRALQLFDRYHEGMGLPAEKPRHASGPGVGLNRYDFADVVAKAYNEDFSGLDPEGVISKEVGLIRNDVIRAYERANVGITGANALSREGYAVIMHNEGNVGRISMLSKVGEKTKHIIVTTIEKILPTLEDAITKSKIEAIYATGAKPSYIEVVGGPSKTADIERVLFPGVSGPTEVHIVLVDNGRSKVAKSEFREVLTCISCGRCVFNCPSYMQSGPAFGYRGYPGGIGAMFCALYEGVERGVENGLFLCATCGECEIECPMGIKTQELIPKLRGLAIREGLIPEIGKIRKMLEDKKNLYDRDNSERLEDIDLEGVPEKSENLLYVGCSFGFRDKKVVNDSIRILKKLGVEFTVLDDEVCCGELLKVLGDDEGFERIVNENRKSFRDSGVKKIITLCPSCFDTLKESVGDEFEVIHMTQLLSKEVKKLDLESTDMRITYHDPCHLGRSNGIYEEPREILNAIDGLELVEFKKNRDKSWCCGAGGGLLALFNSLSARVAIDRLGQAEGLDVERIITFCPGCKNNLVLATKRTKSDIKVYNLPELIAELMKE